MSWNWKDWPAWCLRVTSQQAFEVTRAVTRSQAKATSEEPEVVWAAEPPSPEEEEMENAPAQAITTTEPPVEVDRPRKRRGQRELLSKPKRQRDPLEEPPKDTSNRSSGSGKETRGSQRSQPLMLERVTAILQNLPQLMQRQYEDMVLRKIRKELQEAGNRGSGGGEYVLDDNGLLWVAPWGKIPRFAVPRSIVPGIMALAHSTYGHPGTARFTALISNWFCWLTLIKDVRDYVLSCGCRRRKRSASQRVAMLPSRFLRPGEVLEVDIQGMGVNSDAGNKVLLVAFDTASKFFFAFPLPTKEALGEARNRSKRCIRLGYRCMFAVFRDPSLRQR